ncbi:MAG: hypothetical protein K2X64_11630 [Rhodocyclaceae bacterium]|nr:hypothetical protein [Rhodocyclaceae bacterium]
MDRVHLMPKVFFGNLDIDSQSTGQPDKRHDMAMTPVINVSECLPCQSTAVATTLPHPKNRLSKIARLLKLPGHSQLAG